MYRMRIFLRVKNFLGCLIFPIFFAANGRCILGSFLKVNVQNENIFACQIFFGVLDIPDIFCGKR